MGHSLEALAAIAVAIGLAACGDPLVVVGDAPGIVRVVAGQPETAGDSLGARATESLLSGPRGVAAGPDGTFYVADHMNARLLAVASNGEVRVLLDHSRRQEEPRIERPDGIALDGAGSLVIADPRGHRVWRLELASGAAAPIAGTGLQGAGPDSIPALQADLSSPVGVAATADGRVYFTELTGHRVRRIDPDGTLVTIAGTGVAGFGGDGGPAGQAALRQPAGLALGSAALYIADSGNHRVRVIDLETTVIETIAGTGGAGFRGDGGPAGDALLDSPYSIALSPGGGTLFIADTDNHRVRSLSLATMTISTFAGTGDVEFNGDLLPAAQTSLSRPRGLAVSPMSFLYISDATHQIVRRTAVGFLNAPSSARDAPNM